jgi:NitT/TauT family transport system permease protein
MEASVISRRPRRLTPDRIERIVEFLPWGLGLVGWELLSLAADGVPGPIDVVDFLFTKIDGSVLLDGLVLTSVRFWAAMGLALVIGVVIGLLLGRSPIARGLLRDPTIVALALPAFPWALLGAMWWGVGWQAPVLAAVMVGVPFIAINVSEGVESVSQQLEAMSRAYGVRRMKRIRSLFLPAIVGYTVAGFRVAVIVGWNAVLITEWFAGSDGIGFQAHYWYTVPSTEGFLALALVFVLYIVIVDRLIVETLYRRTQRWRGGGKADVDEPVIAA